MNNVDSARLWQRIDPLEQSLCLRVNRGCDHPAVRRLFAAMSRLGDIVWSASAPTSPTSASASASRVVLGLHYPTDVAAGALIGATLAGNCLWVAGA